MSPSKLSRRALVTAAPGTADPIFAAIERCQKIDNWETRALLAETAPTTLPGLAAYVSFLRHQSVDVLETFFFDEGGNEQLAFIESLDRSLASIVPAREAVRS